MINKKLANLLKDIPYGFFILYSDHKKRIDVFKHNLNNFITIIRKFDDYYIPLTKLTYLDFELIRVEYIEYKFKFYNMYKIIKRLLVYIIVYVCGIKVDKEEDMAPVGYLTKYDMYDRTVLGFLTDKILK